MDSYKIQVRRLITKNILLIVAILIGLFFLIPLMHSGFYLTHDGEAQVARFGAYIKAFQDGQIIPRWAGDLNYGYGSSVLIFYYPMPGLISVPLHYLGLNLETIFKIIIGTSFIMCFVSFFLWIKELTRDDLSALVGSVLYGLAPYHFLNLYVRGDIAELLSLSVVPFIFLCIDKIAKKESIGISILAALFYAFVILSHNSVSLIFSPIILIYVLFVAKTNKSKLLCLLFITLGLLISAFFWVPAIVEAKYTNANLFIGDMFKNNYPDFRSLIYSNWGFGPDVNKSGGLSPQLGLISVLIMLLSIPLIWSKNKKIFLTKFWMAVLLILLFMNLKISMPLWLSVPFLKELQFPWRLVGISSFAAAVVGSFFISQFSNKIKFLVLVLIILYSFQFLKVNAVQSKPDSFYFTYPGTTYYHGQASSIWTAGDFYKYPSQKIEIIAGRGKIINESVRSNLHLIRFYAINNVVLLDNTSYFPGWAAFVDGRKQNIEFQDMNHRGLLTFKVPSGSHLIKVEFLESGVRLVSDIISLGGVICLLLIVALKRKIGKALK